MNIFVYVLAIIELSIQWIMANWLYVLSMLVIVEISTKSTKINQGVKSDYVINGFALFQFRRSYI